MKFPKHSRQGDDLRSKRRRRARRAVLARSDAAPPEALDARSGDRERHLHVYGEGVRYAQPFEPAGGDAEILQFTAMEVREGEFLQEGAIHVQRGQRLAPLQQARAEAGAGGGDEVGGDGGVEPEADKFQGVERGQPRRERPVDGQCIAGGGEAENSQRCEVEQVSVAEPAADGEVGAVVAEGEAEGEEGGGISAAGDGEIDEAYKVGEAAAGDVEVVEVEVEGGGPEVAPPPREEGGRYDRFSRQVGEDTLQEMARERREPIHCGFFFSVVVVVVVVALLTIIFIYFSVIFFVFVFFGIFDVIFSFFFFFNF